jgi:gamma-glutamylcyclotransferase (GGCT)/AIG2-like uncharacterized protein YtfP
MTKKIKLLVYGSLRKGEFNHERFGKNSLSYIKTIAIPDFKMYSLIHYPAAVPIKDKTRVIICDVVECTEDVFNLIRRMEQLAGYIMTSVTYEGENHYMFIMAPTKRFLNDLRVVESGDWSKNK